MESSMPRTSHLALSRLFLLLAVLALLATACGTDPGGAANDDDDAAPCDPSGLWTLHLTPTLSEPDGCGSNGIVAQSEAEHIIEVSSDGSGGWDLVLLDPSAKGLDSSTLTVSFSGAQDGCQLAMGLENIVTMASPAGLATIILDYNHSVTSDSSGALSGSGSVHFYSTETTPSGNGTVMQDCTEPFDLVGSFAPAD
jgi:hypothetical protein